MRYILIFFVLITMQSCEKILFEKDLASNDPLINFEYLWNEVDKKYSYLDYKGISWDEIRTKYHAKIFENMTEDSLFSVLASMLNELRDDHVNLVSPFNTSAYNVYLTGTNNFNQRTIDEYYLTDNRYTGAFSHGFLRKQKIAYLRYKSFNDDVDQLSLDHILDRYKNTTGLILDLRSNEGGSVINIPMILERFTDQETLVGYNITRNGPNKNDFGNREPFYIGVHNGIKYNNPVMVLIDKGCYSACTFFAFATKAFSNITLIGDTTGGGGGLPNGGQLPNGWTYRFSISQLIDLKGNNYAEDGVAPDIIAYFDWSDLTKDEIIERAILEIK